VKVASGKGLFCNDCKTRTGAQKRNKLLNIFDDIASQPGFAEHSARNGPVASLWRKNQRSLS